MEYLLMQNIFSTKSEADKAQAYDYNKYISSDAHSGASEKWLEMTRRWAYVKQRVTDGKWYYPVWPYSDVKHVTEMFDSSWSPNGGNLITHRTKSEVVKSNSIKKCNSDKYFIASQGDKLAYGVVTAGQVMVTGLENIEVLDQLDKFKSRCSKYNIDIDSPDFLKGFKQNKGRNK